MEFLNIFARFWVQTFIWFQANFDFSKLIFENLNKKKISQIFDYIYKKDIKLFLYKNYLIIVNINDINFFLGTI